MIMITGITTIMITHMTTRMITIMITTTTTRPIPMPAIRMAQRARGGPRPEHGFFLVKILPPRALTLPVFAKA